MIKFYELLGDPNTTYPAALRSAQLWLKEMYPDPAIWGAFICQGFEVRGRRSSILSNSITEASP